MHALALALLLAADPAAPAPAAAPAPSAPAADPALAPPLVAPGALAPSSVPPAAPTISAPAPAPAAARADVHAAADLEDEEDRAIAPRQFRFGLGGGVVSGGSGVSPTALVGVELDPWSPFGIRAGLGMVTSVGGGEWTSAELTAALVYRPLRAAALSPYLTAGVQLATLTIAPQDHSFGPPLARSTISLAAAAPGGDPEAAPSANTSPSGPVHYSVAPELGAGLGLPLVEGLALDVGVRYLPLRWEGEVRHAFTGVVAVCSPF